MGIQIQLNTVFGKYQNEQLMKDAKLALDDENGSDTYEYDDEDLRYAGERVFKLLGGVSKENAKIILKEFAARSSSVMRKMLGEGRALFQDPEMALAEVALESENDDLLADADKKRRAVKWIKEGVSVAKTTITHSPAQSLLQIRANSFLASQSFTEPAIREALNAAACSLTLTQSLLAPRGFWSMVFGGKNKFALSLTKGDLRSLMQEKSGVSIQIREHVRNRVLNPTFAEWLFRSGFNRAFKKAELADLKAMKFELVEPAKAPIKQAAPASQVAAVDQLEVVTEPKVEVVVDAPASQVDVPTTAADESNPYDKLGLEDVSSNNPYAKLGLEDVSADSALLDEYDDYHQLDENDENKGPALTGDLLKQLNVSGGKVVRGLPCNEGGLESFLKESQQSPSKSATQKLACTGYRTPPCSPVRNPGSCSGAARRLPLSPIRV